MHRTRKTTTQNWDGVKERMRETHHWQSNWMRNGNMTELQASELTQASIRKGNQWLETGSGVDPL